jgi:hypothetical protein
VRKLPPEGDHTESEMQVPTMCRTSNARDFGRTWFYPACSTYQAICALPVYSLTRPQCRGCFRCSEVRWFFGTSRGANCRLVRPGGTFERLIKGGAPKWIHDTFPEHRDFSWQDGYGAFSVGITQVDDTVRYVERQAEHHQRHSYQDEFLAFLRKHDINYDPRYALDGERTASVIPDRTHPPRIGFVTQR